jgi:hypothetical protein
MLIEGSFVPSTVTVVKQQITTAECFLWECTGQCSFLWNSVHSRIRPRRLGERLSSSFSRWRHALLQSMLWFIVAVLFKTLRTLWRSNEIGQQSCLKHSFQWNGVSSSSVSILVQDALRRMLSMLIEGSLFRVLWWNTRLRLPSAFCENALNNVRFFGTAFMHSSSKAREAFTQLLLMMTTCFATIDAVVHRSSPV